MKVRNDFVSNSSSSSFVLVGKIFDAVSVVKQFIKAKIVSDEIAKQYKDGEISEEDVIYEAIENTSNVEIERSGDDYNTEEVCVGLSPSKMKDTETLGNFKEKVRIELEALGLKAKFNEIDFVSGGSDASGMSFFDSCG